MFQKKKARKSNFFKIRPVGAALLHADGQTDRHDGAKCSVSQFSERA